jgi:hypothetical protein
MRDHVGAQIIAHQVGVPACAGQKILHAIGRAVARYAPARRFGSIRLKCGEIRSPISSSPRAQRSASLRVVMLGTSSTESNAKLRL